MKRFLLIFVLLAVLLAAAAAAEPVRVDDAHFPDPVLRSSVANSFDTDGDGWLSEGEQAAAIQLDLAYTDAASLDGLAWLPALQTLLCNGTAITALDVSGNPALTLLNCAHTGITSLDVSGNPALSVLYCGGTGITSLDVSGNPALTVLSVTGAPLCALDLSHNPRLAAVYDGCGRVVACGGSRYDLSAIEGLDLSRVLSWVMDPDGCLSGTVLTIPASREARYLYDCGGGWRLGFTLYFEGGSHMAAGRYEPIRAAAEELTAAGRTVYLDMWEFWGLQGAQDAAGGLCPRYVPISDTTAYQDVSDGNSWVSAHDLFAAYLAAGQPLSGQQRSWLYLRPADVRPGDADLDGELTLADVTAMLRTLPDGDYTAADAVSLLWALCR